MPVSEQFRSRILGKLRLLYGERAEGVLRRIDRLADQYSGLRRRNRDSLWDQRSVVLITYGDQVRGAGQAALEAQRQFLMDYDITNNRTYMYFPEEPLFPFGYGLSYSSFEYSDMRTGSPELSSAGEITVSVDIRNTGERDGDEVIQLYVSYPSSAVERPVKELKGFKRIPVKAGIFFSRGPHS